MVPFGEEHQILSAPDVVLWTRKGLPITREMCQDMHHCRQGESQHVKGMVPRKNQNALPKRNHTAGRARTSKIAQ